MNPEGMGLVQNNVKGRDTVTQTIPAVCFDVCSKVYKAVSLSFNH